MVIRYYIVFDENEQVMAIELSRPRITPGGWDGQRDTYSITNTKPDDPDNEGNQRWPGWKTMMFIWAKDEMDAFLWTQKHKGEEQ